MTIAYVVVTVVTYFFWWLKPKDIATASPVGVPHMDIEQRQVFESLSMESTYDVVDPTVPWKFNIAWCLIGRDCKDDEVLVMPRVESRPVTSSGTSLAPSQGGTTATQAGAPQIPRGSLDLQPEKYVVQRAKPLQAHALYQEENDSKIITEWDSGLYMSKGWPLICLVGASFGVVHFIAWNSIFPTTIELWLWRTGAVVSVATSILCMQFRQISLHWNGLLTIVQLASPILYVISRAIMTAQTFAALRAMPVRTYDTFDLWNYWFHFV